MFYHTLENLLQIGNPKEKIEKFNQFYKLYKSNNTEFESTFHPKEFDKPSYSTVCTIVPPQVVPKRTNLTTKEGQINLLHAIAHIEYSAIDLALDAAYRFQGLPKKYYDDWLEVAEDEVRHFIMLEELLNDLGATIWRYKST